MSTMFGTQIVKLLDQALKKEKKFWKPFSYTTGESNVVEITAEHRDSVVKWLIELNDKHHFMPETICLTVTLLDSFLQSVQAHPKYLKCIAISCFFVAMKFVEEEGSIPIIKKLVLTSECGCTSADVIRMEGIVLRKLSWNLKRVTTLDFLHVFHAILAIQWPGILGGIEHGDSLRWLEGKLKACLPYHKLLLFRPSVVALSLISLELEFRMWNWIGFIFALQKVIKVENSDFIRCREQISEILVHVYGCAIPRFPPKNIRCLAEKPTKRKMEQTDVEDIYDSIKQLYREDTTPSLCGSAAKYEGRSSLNDLPPPSVVPAV